MVEDRIPKSIFKINQREIDSEVDHRFVGGTICKLILKQWKIELEEEAEGQRWLEEVHRGGEGSHRAEEPVKKKNITLFVITHVDYV